MSEYSWALSDWHLSRLSRELNLSDLISWWGSVWKYTFITISNLIHITSWIKYSAHSLMHLTSWRLTQMSQESTVPKQHRPSLTAFLTVSELSSNHRIFTALKYVDMGRPHRACIIYTIHIFLANFYKIFKTFYLKLKQLLEIIINKSCESPWGIPCYFPVCFQSASSLFHHFSHPSTLQYEHGTVSRQRHVE